MIPPLAGYALNWLADAEISYQPAQPAKTGLSLFFTDDIEYGRFCRVAELPAAAVGQAEAIRTRFDLAPRHWIKLHYDAAQRTGMSQYFVLDPRNVYPITTLRLCLRECGLSNARGLEPAFEPALQRAETLWAVIVKRSAERIGARVSCRITRSLLGDLFTRLVRHGYVSGRLAAQYLEHDSAIVGGASAYLSVDPAMCDSCSVDYEDVAPASIPEVCKPFWMEGDANQESRYLKCRLHPQTGEVQWTVYRPLHEVLTAEHYQQLGAVGMGDGAAYRRRVRSYYDRFSQTIVDAVGATYQAGLIKTAQSTDPVSASNRQLAARAGLAPGQRLLDAGCGAGGPSIDVCRAVPGLQVAAITISTEQAKTARQLIRGAGLADRIRVHVGNYHDLPFAPETFDRVWFLESIGYAEDLRKLFDEAFRVLKRGGSVYVKDVFRCAGALSGAERLELAEFDRLYVQRTPAVEDAAVALRHAGFRDVAVADLSDCVSMEHFNRAMLRGRRLRADDLTAFGQHHYRSFKRLPVHFAQMRATRP